MIFVNLPVDDLARSRDFFTALGFGVDEQFSDEGTTCVVVEENVVVMLLERSRFEVFTRDGAAPRGSAPEALLCLSAATRQEVDDLADRAETAGGTAWMPPRDHGALYGRSFADPDGHVWEVLWMDPEQVHG